MASSDYQSLGSGQDLERGPDHSARGAQGDGLNDPFAEQPSDDLCVQYEYCGPFCGHEFHWTETLFLAFLIISFTLMVLAWVGVSIPGLLFAIGLMLYSLAALKLFWGYLNTHTLAKFALQLKSYASDFKSSTKQHVEFNEQLKLENKAIADSLQDFKASAGLLDAHATDIHLVEKKLFEVFDKHQRLIEEQNLFDMEHERFLAVQEEYRVALKLESIKERLRDQFGVADMNRDGIITGEKELAKLKQYVSEAGLKFPPKLDDKNKKTKVWEFMEQLNTVAPTPVLHLKDILADVKKMQQKLKKDQEKLERLKKKVASPSAAALKISNDQKTAAAESDDESDDDEEGPSLFSSRSTVEAFTAAAAGAEEKSAASAQERKGGAGAGGAGAAGPTKLASPSGGKLVLTINDQKGGAKS